MMWRRFSLLLGVTLLPAAGADAQDSTEAAAVRPVEVTLREVRELRGEGRAGEAESLLRQAREESTDTRLDQELADVLLEQAGTMDWSEPLSRHLATGLVREALLLYAGLPEHAVPVADRVLPQARCLELLDRDEEAETLLAEALEHPQTEDPEHAAILGALLRFLIQRDRGEEAELLLERSHRSGRGGATPLALLRLELAAARRDPDSIRDAASDALASGADSWQVGYLVWEGLSGGAAEDLLDGYSALLERNPEDAALLYYRGVARQLADDPAGAESDLERSRSDPRTALRAVYWRGCAALARDQLELARERFEEVLRRNEVYVGDSLNQLLNVAARLGQRREYGAARDLYARVLAAAPDNRWALLGSALCFKHLDDVAGAEQAYQEALRQRPGDPELLNDYALLLQGSGQPERARELFGMAMAAGSPDAAENLGILALDKERDATRAAQLFARVLRQEPDRVKSRFYREIALLESRSGSRGDSGDGGVTERGGDVDRLPDSP